jgi:hypothetical protein
MNVQPMDRTCDLEAHCCASNQIAQAESRSSYKAHEPSFTCKRGWPLLASPNHPGKISTIVPQCLSARPLRLKPLAKDSSIDSRLARSC